MKIIFILYNIFESKSGVSNKYIKLINYLISQNMEYLLFTTFNDNQNINNDYKIIYKKGIHLPFYHDIKIPNISINDLKTNVKNNDIIIFNGEFFWLYTIFKELKNIYNDIKLIPNWHTNYDYYSKIYTNNLISIDNIKNNLYNNLKNNFFSGIIVTGEITKNDFSKYSSNVFNANEISLSNFDIFKIDDYNLNDKINFIFTGRISIEKNLNLIIDIMNEFNNEESKFNNFNLHIIGDGPYMNQLKKYIKDDLEEKIIFYGNMDYTKIKDIYQKLDNRIFIQSSKSETFGKTTMEASYSGIPIFIVKCEIHNLLYNENNSFMFDNIQEFKNQLILFFRLNTKQKEKIIKNGFNNANKYDQNIIFENLKNFLLKINNNSNNFYKQMIISNVLNSIQCGIDYFES